MALVPSPVVPVQSAGEVATAADMNSLAAASQFLLNRPITIAQQASTAVSSSALVQANPVFTSAVVDIDGMYTNGSQFLTVQRYGLYWFEASWTVNIGTNSWQAFLGAASGPNNPYAVPGTSLYTAQRFGYPASAVPSYGTIASVVPVPLFPGDEIFSVIWNSQGGTSGTASSLVTVRWIGEG